MLDSKVLNTDYDLAEMSDLQRPNLLDNADFKNGIINQRGKTSYNGTQGENTYTIDRWCVGQNNNLVLAITNGYISTSIPNQQWIAQFIEHKPEGAMTVAIKMKDTELKVLSLSNYINDDGTLKYDFGELQTNVPVRLYKYPDDDNWQFYILNNTGNTLNLNIEYIKLEKGSVFTGMPLWNETSELLKCMRYFQYLDINETIWSTQYDNQFEQNIMFMLPMIKTPSITTDMTDNYNVTNVSAIAKDKNRCSLRYTLDKTIGSGHRIGLRINADAEIY